LYYCCGIFEKKNGCVGVLPGQNIHLIITVLWLPKPHRPNGCVNNISVGVDNFYVANGDACLAAISPPRYSFSDPA